MAIDSKSLLTVGELSRRSGLPVSTIHFYEKKELIESWRTAGNQRRYPRSILRKVAVIRIAQRAGVPLAIIKDHLDEFPSDQITAKDWARLSKDWHTMLNERITSLMQLRDELSGCIGCGCLSLADCPLRNPQDVLAREGAGARLLKGTDF